MRCPLLISWNSHIKFVKVFLLVWMLCIGGEVHSEDQIEKLREEIHTAQQTIDECEMRSLAVGEWQGYFNAYNGLLRISKESSALEPLKKAAEEAQKRLVTEIEQRQKNLMNRK